jgi:hypothetical protein
MRRLDSPAPPFARDVVALRDHVVALGERIGRNRPSRNENPSKR